MKLISCRHANSLARHFGINKIQELIARKYYWAIFRQDIKVYIKGYNVYLSAKTIFYKLYGDLWSLSDLIHY